MGLASQSTSKPGSQQNKASKPADQKQKVADHPDNKVAQMRNIIAQGNEKKTFVPESESTSTNFDGKQPEKNESGEKLDSKTQQKMESGFGTDFKDVRVHTGGEASKLADETDSKAFAHGQDVFFKEGEYKPGTMEGDALIAHELSHTVQQRGATEESTTTNEAQVEQDANESTVGVLQAILMGGKKIMPKMRAGLSVSRCSSDKAKEKGNVEVGELTQDTIPAEEEISTTPSYITPDLKTKITATILAESYSGQEEQVRWIYFGRVKKAKGENGLSGSSAYSGKHSMYKVWLYMLGDTTYSKSTLPQTLDHFKGHKTVKDYCETEYMKSQGASRAERVKGLVDEMYSGGVANPYEGWEGQGNIKDFNNESNQDIYWKRARAYYWLQESDTVSVTKYVEILKQGSNTQFIFNAAEIKKYWDKPENKLPKVVPKYEP